MFSVLDPVLTSHVFPPRNTVNLTEQLTKTLLRAAAAQILTDLHILGALWKIIVQRCPNPQCCSSVEVWLRMFTVPKKCRGYCRVMRFLHGMV